MNTLLIDDTKAVTTIKLLHFFNVEAGMFSPPPETIITCTAEIQED